MAVYTELDEDALHDFLDGFDVSPLTGYCGIEEGVENSNFLLETKKANYVLTLLEARAEGRDLPFFLALMTHLAAAGIPCPKPVVKKKADAPSTLMGKPALIVTFLEGRSKTGFDAEDCRSVGCTLAMLHLAAADFKATRSNGMGGDAWNAMARGLGENADKIMPGLAETIEQEIAHLASVWPTALPTGVIHADLFPDNVLWQKDKISGIIDFYFACTDALTYDLAITLIAWCFEADDEIDIAKARAMIEGYATLRPLEVAEKAALPTLMRGAALRFLLSRTHDWLHTDKEALVQPKNPLEYLGILRCLQQEDGNLTNVI